MSGVFGDAFHRAHFYALRRIKMAHTFCAKQGIDLVNLDTLVNGLVGTFGLAYITVDAFFGDGQCQGQLLTNPNCSLSASWISEPTN